MGESKMYCDLYGYGDGLFPVQLRHRFFQQFPSDAVFPCGLWLCRSFSSWRIWNRFYLSIVDDCLASTRPCSWWTHSVSVVALVPSSRVLLGRVRVQSYCNYRSDYHQLARCRLCRQNLPRYCQRFVRLRYDSLYIGSLPRQFAWLYGNSLHLPSELWWYFRRYKNPQYQGLTILAGFIYAFRNYTTRSGYQIPLGVLYVIPTFLFVFAYVPPLPR